MSVFNWSECQLGEIIYGLIFKMTSDLHHEFFVSDHSGILNTFHRSTTILSNSKTTIEHQGGQSNQETSKRAETFVP